MERWGQGLVDGMIIPLSRIAPTGLRQSVRMALAQCPRLVDLWGPQTESLLAEVLLKNRSGHVEVTGTIQAKVRVTCNRCLDPVTVEIDEPVQVTLAPETQAVGAPGEDTQLAVEDLDVSFYAGDAIELIAVLEDELILMIPELPCEEDEQGCCTCCGRSVADVLQETEPDEAFHPLAGLRKFVREPDRNKR